MSDREYLSMTYDEAIYFKKICDETPKGKTFFFKEKEILKEYGEYMIQFMEKTHGNLSGK